MAEPQRRARLADYSASSEERRMMKNTAMTHVAVAVVVLLVLASGVLGYYIGITSQGAGSRDSSTTTSGSIPSYQLWIPNGNWTNSYTSKSGSCGASSLSYFNPATGAFHVGPYEATCYTTIGPSEAGTITLEVVNSGSGTNIVFEDASSYASDVFFPNSQGCGSPGAIGLCYIAGHSTALFNITFVSIPGTYKPINVTLDVVVAVSSSS